MGIYDNKTIHTTHSKLKVKICEMSGKKESLQNKLPIIPSNAPLCHSHH
jgi:hypothetical protein